MPRDRLEVGKSDSPCFGLYVVFPLFPFLFGLRPRRDALLTWLSRSHHLRCFFWRRCLPYGFWRLSYVPVPIRSLWRSPACSWSFGMTFMVSIATVAWSVRLDHEHGGLRVRKDRGFSGPPRCSEGFYIESPTCPRRRNSPCSTGAHVCASLVDHALFPYVLPLPQPLSVHLAFVVDVL